MPLGHIVTYSRPPQRSGAGLKYAPGVPTVPGGGAQPWSVAEVCGGTVADKSPRELQGLSRAPRGGGAEISEDSAPPPGGGGFGSGGAVGRCRAYSPRCTVSTGVAPAVDGYPLLRGYPYLGSVHQR